MHVAHDADDLSVRVVSVAYPYRLANRIPIAEVFARERVVDDHDGLRICGVLRGEGAAAQHADVQRLEVARARGAIVGRWLVARLVRRSPANVERQHIPADQRQRLDEADRRDVAALQRRCERIVELLLRCTGRVRARRQRDLEREHVRRVEAGVHVRQLGEASQEQERARHEHERQPDLRDEQHGARGSAVGCCRSAAAACQRRRDVRTRGLPGRHHAEDQRGEARRGHGEREHVRVHRDVGHARQGLRTEPANGLERELSEHHAERSAGDCQHETFGQELHGDARAAGAERTADRDLPLAHGTAHEQQVRDVHAADQHDEADGTEEREQRRPDVADDLILQRHDVRRFVGVGVRILRGQPAGHRLDLLVRMREVHTVGQPSDDAEKVGAARCTRGIDREGLPEVRRPRRKVEVRRHDAEDGRGHAVDGDRSADDRGIAAESRPPELRADHDHRCARPLVFSRERRADERVDAERLEQIRRRRDPRDAIRSVGSHERRARDRERREPAERMRLLAPVEEIRRRDGEHAVFRHDLTHAHQSIRLRVRQRVQQHAVDDAEHGSAGADAERDRQDRDEREARRRNELSYRVSHVANEMQGHHDAPLPFRRAVVDAAEPSIEQG
jgi:hypothetical protein